MLASSNVMRGNSDIFSVGLLGELNEVLVLIPGT
jgi:hypothetical protein